MRVRRLLARFSPDLLFLPGQTSDRSPGPENEEYLGTYQRHLRHRRLWPRGHPQPDDEPHRDEQHGPGRHEAVHGAGSAGREVGLVIRTHRQF